MASKMTPERLRSMEIKELREQIEALKKEKEQKSKIAEEKAEIQRLMQEVHPSKVGKLKDIVGKSTEMTPERKKKVISALRGLKKAGHEFNKLRAEIRAYGQRKR